MSKVGALVNMNFEFLFCHKFLWMNQNEWKAPVMVIYFFRNGNFKLKSFQFPTHEETQIRGFYCFNLLFTSLFAQFIYAAVESKKKNKTVLLFFCFVLLLRKISNVKMFNVAFFLFNFLFVCHVMSVETFC